MLARVTAFITDPVILAYLTVGGFLLTALGFIVAIWQIRKTRASADAAADAARKAAREFGLREQLMELTDAVAGIEMIRIYADMNNREAAQLALSLLRGRISALPEHDEQGGAGKSDRQNVLDRVAHIQQALALKPIVDTAQIDVNLSGISDILHARLTHLKRHVETGESR